jgi:hypothetical protein
VDGGPPLTLGRRSDQEKCETVESTEQRVRSGSATPNEKASITATLSAHTLVPRYFVIYIRWRYVQPAVNKQDLLVQLPLGVTPCCCRMPSEVNALHLIHWAGLIDVRFGIWSRLTAAQIHWFVG